MDEVEKEEGVQSGDALQADQIASALESLISEDAPAESDSGEASSSEEVAPAEEVTAPAPEPEVAEVPSVVESEPEESVEDVIASHPDMQWFVLHTLSGQENKVKEHMSRRLQIEEMEEYVAQVLIPTEKVAEVKQGKRSETVRKFFPGYVLIHIRLYDQDKELVEKSWYFVQETPGIIGFVGGERPVPLRQNEVDVILNQIEEKKEKIKPKVEFTTGETVKINDGPFMNFSGEIEEIDPGARQIEGVCIYLRSIRAG